MEDLRKGSNKTCHRGVGSIASSFLYRDLNPGFLRSKGRRVS